MQAGTGRKVLRSTFLFCAILFALVFLVSAASAQQPAPGDLRRGTTMEGEPTTPTGDVIKPIFDQIIWLSVAVFLLVSIVLVYILIRFRHRRGEKRDVPQTHGNSRLEIAWTIGPALVMVYLLVISYNGLLAIDTPDAEPEFTVDVVGSRFSWTFTYPDGSKAEGALATMRVQEDTWVRLNVTSSDVIHAIAIPGLDVMIDANPGDINTVMFYAREPGMYLVQCRQYCGTGHGDMLAAVEVFASGSQPLPYGDAPRPETPGPGTPADNNTTEEPEVEVDRVIEVRAFDYGFDPSPLQALEPGEVVQVVLINDGPSPHNLFIGDYDPEAGTGEPLCVDPNDDSTCWATEFTVNSGEQDSFILEAPEEDESFFAWCDISGHAALGMLTYVAVGDAEPPTGLDGPQPRLPGPGAGLTLAALGAAIAVVVLARRRP